MDSGLDLSHLTEEEIARINEVLQRDGELQKEVEAKKQRCQHELHNMRKVSTVQRSGGVCARCRQALGVLLGRGTLCPECKETVCDGCQRTDDLVPAKYGWVCTYCLLQRQSTFQSGEWFFSASNLGGGGKYEQPSDQLRKFVSRFTSKGSSQSPDQRRRKGKDSVGAHEVGRRKLADAPGGQPGEGKPKRKKPSAGEASRSTLPVGEKPPGQKKRIRGASDLSSQGKPPTGRKSPSAGRKSPSTGRKSPATPRRTSAPVAAVAASRGQQPVGGDAQEEGNVVQTAPRSSQTLPAKPRLVHLTKDRTPGPSGRSPPSREFRRTSADDTLVAGLPKEEIETRSQRSKSEISQGSVQPQFPTDSAEGGVGNPAPDVQPRASAIEIGSESARQSIYPKRAPKVDAAQHGTPQSSAVPQTAIHGGFALPGLATATVASSVVSSEQVRPAAELYHPASDESASLVGARQAYLKQAEPLAVASEEDAVGPAVQIIPSEAAPVSSSAVANEEDRGSVVAASEMPVTTTDRNAPAGDGGEEQRDRALSVQTAVKEKQVTGPRDENESAQPEAPEQAPLAPSSGSFKGIQRRTNVKKSRRRGKPGGDDQPPTSTPADVSGVANVDPVSADQSQLAEPPASYEQQSALAGSADAVLAAAASQLGQASPGPSSGDKAGHGDDAISEREQARQRALERVRRRRANTGDLPPTGGHEPVAASVQSSEAVLTSPARAAAVQSSPSPPISSQDRARRVAVKRAQEMQQKRSRGRRDSNVPDGQQSDEKEVQQEGKKEKQDWDSGSDQEEDSGEMDIDAYFAEAKEGTARRTSAGERGPAPTPQLDVGALSSDRPKRLSRQVSDDMRYSVDSLDERLQIAGSVQYDLRYIGGRLQVQLNGCRGLNAASPSCNIHAKVYLLPDLGKTGKRQTSAQSFSVQPSFDDMFSYTVGRDDLQCRTLSVSIWLNQSGGGSHNTFFGGVKLDLAGMRLGSDWTSFDERLSDEPHSRSLASASQRRHSGYLKVAVRYTKAADKRCTVEVDVQRANGISAADPDDLADAFVRGIMLPDFRSKVKTSVIRQTLQPEWNERLSFPGWKNTDLLTGVVELGLWDHDSESSNDFLGATRLGLSESRCPPVASSTKAKWRDVTADEEKVWQAMLDHKGDWIEATLPLRDISPHQ